MKRLLLASLLLAAPAGAQELPAIVADSDGNVTQAIQGVQGVDRDDADQLCIRNRDTGQTIACASPGSVGAIVPVTWPLNWGETYMIDGYAVGPTGTQSEPSSEWRQVSRPKNPAPNPPTLLE